MKIPTSSYQLFVVFLILSSTFSWAADSTDNFIRCLNPDSENPAINTTLIFTPANSTYTEALLYSINNLRFAKPETPKPLVIVTPTSEPQIQTVINCSKQNSLEMRIRSGGHSFEGLSYVAQVPFVLLDLRNISSVTVDLKTATAWVDSGVTNGELYYRIGMATTDYGFPSGLWSNVGVGGILSGGGYGMMRRKFGLAADNVIDARLIDAGGRILTRKSMGEDLFWAIRGGGGGSFGVVISWRVNLIPVPKTVTVFRVTRILEQGLTNTFYKWQSAAPKFPKELDIRCTGQSILSNASTRADKKTMGMLFESLYLGGADDLLSVMQERLPELGLTRADCSEVSWLQAMLFFSNFPLDAPPEILLNKTILPRPAFKGRSDFTKVPIPVEGLEGLWEKMFEILPEAATLQFTPFGGRLDEISESALPFPYRAGTLFMMNMFALTNFDEANQMEWVGSLAKYLTPYVTSNPRSAYVNYVNLWIGINNPVGSTSYAQAIEWGRRYFKNNFERLVLVKSQVDPDNFFRHEQSIPPLSFWSDM